ncbi:MAG: SpoIIE family protein phosphatase, partial [Oligoflexia bacterium]|nr:SpoIIE family protein phosphatase [Oligoflexia bacterium]
MDSLLLVGSEDPKLDKFLQRLGYQVIQSDGKTPLTEVLTSTTYDMVIIDSRANKNLVEFCEFLLAHESTKTVPIVGISESPAERYNLKELCLSKVELADAPYSIGSLAARIATQLRLAKFAGTDARTASLTEANAALRELNKRFGKELEEARGIQESLLPKELPKDDRFSIAASYQPLNEVGGDSYHVAVGPNGKLTVQIADVTGHGISAALIGSMTKLALAAAAKEEPDELLTDMNRLISPQLPEGRFVTVCSYLYDPTNGQLVSARGGHPPVMILQRASGKVLQLKAEGFPLGFLPDSKYKSASASLEVNDIALLITDGISEAQNRAHDTYGLDNIGKSLLSSDPSWGAKEILAHVLKDFNKFR